MPATVVGIGVNGKLILVRAVKKCKCHKAQKGNINATTVQTEPKVASANIVVMLVMRGGEIWIRYQTA